MNEPRNRARKVTRKAGPPESADQQPVFQAPENPASNQGGTGDSVAAANNGNGHGGNSRGQNGNGGHD